MGREAASDATFRGGPRASSRHLFEDRSVWWNTPHIYIYLVYIYMYAIGLLVESEPGSYLMNLDVDDVERILATKM